MAVSLSDISVTSATPGVLVKGTVDPELFSSGNLIVVAGVQNDKIISDQIDASYIVNGDTAYWTYLRLQLSGELDLYLDSNANVVGSPTNPQFTETAEDNIWVVLFYGTTSAAWDFNELQASDDDEPYVFNAASITAAGPTNNAALRTAINADTSVIAMLVDASHPQIDIATLSTVDLNTAPEVTFTAPTSPVDGSATQTVAGTFSDDQGNDTATITIAASLGTLGAVTKDDTAGTWEAEYTAPASTASEQTDTLTVTATDDGALTDTASQDVTIRVTDLMPSLPPIFSQSATVGTAFSLTFSAATGGDPPLTYALSGNPAWLTLSGFTLSGTPDATGTHQVRVTVEDDDGDTAFRQFALTVSAAVDLTPSLPAIAEPDVQQSEQRSVSLSTQQQVATHPSPILSAAILLGLLCLVLRCRARRQATGTHTVTVTVTDNDNDTDSRFVHVLTVSAAAVLLTLADFDVPTGHDEVDAALITSGLDNNGWHYNVDLSVGTLEDGTLEPEASYEITRIRHNITNTLQLNDNPDSADLSAFFASAPAMAMT